MISLNILNICVS